MRRATKPAPIREQVAWAARRGLRVAVCSAPIVASAAPGPAPPAEARATEAAARRAACVATAVRPVLGLLAEDSSWASYKTRFVTDDGRVIDTANARISHSEGQGYGLLLALAAGDRGTFRRIWDWTRAHLMVRPDALPAWRWDPEGKPPVADTNNATDGDLLIAWALGEASQAWPDEGFRRAARRIAAEVGERAVLWRAEGGPLLLPGLSGFTAGQRGDGPVVNLSYWVFPAFPRLAAVAPEYDWLGLCGAGLDLVPRVRFGPARLPTEWIAMGGGMPRPAAGFSAEFSYNAVRIPLYLAMAGVEHGYDAFAQAWAQPDHRGLPVVDAPTGRPTGWMGEPGYAAVAQLTACAASGTRLPDSFMRPSPTENYYPATLHLLALVAARMHYPTCFTR